VRRGGELGELEQLEDLDDAGDQGRELEQLEQLEQLPSRGRLMIALVVGAPGSGKSYTSVALIAEALRAGKPVATNIELAEDWPELVVASMAGARLRGRAWRERRAERLRSLVHVSGELDELFRVRLVGCGKCRGCDRGGICRRENRGVMVLDEAHNWMNARTWDADGVSASKNEAVQRRLGVVRFFSQHRKLGWSVYLITQDENNVDRQVRTLFECLVRLRNLHNFKFIGIPIVPVNLFLAIWQWNDPSKSVLRRQVRRLDKRVARLYDTMALSHGAGDELLEAGGAIMLPRPAVVVDELAELAESAAPAPPPPADRPPAPGHRPLKFGFRARPTDSNSNGDTDSNTDSESDSNTDSQCDSDVKLAG
jgi:hypothetical protein